MAHRRRSWRLVLGASCSSCTFGSPGLHVGGAASGTQGRLVRRLMRVGGDDGGAQVDGLGCERMVGVGISE